MFVKPEERIMSVNAFCDVLEGKSTLNGVGYAQRQNDSLRQEFEPLCADLDLRIPWAGRVFGGEPDAINLWIGNADAVTSLHKDHYENLYCVVAGEKHFTLLPPSDAPFLYTADFPDATYRSAASLNFLLRKVRSADTMQ
jgi:hypothetical protein